jgi:predicted acylesterase/phospholipase RssA
MADAHDKFGPLDRIGVCLSGGGFRAALYEAGALKALIDAELWPQVSSLSSVSGGSILNAFLFVSEWKSEQSKNGVEDVPPDLHGFCDRIRKRGLFLISTFVMLILLFILVIAVIWHRVPNVGVLIGSGLLFAAAIAGSRGLILSHAISVFLSEVSALKKQELAKLSIPPRIRLKKDRVFVFVATDLSDGSPFFVTTTSVGSPFRGWCSEIRISLPTVVAASAAVPVLFPTVGLNLSKGQFVGGLASVASSKKVWLGDGGISNNLGSDWLEHTGKPDLTVIIDASSFSEVKIKFPRSISTMVAIKSSMYANTIKPRLAGFRGRADAVVCSLSQPTDGQTLGRFTGNREYRTSLRRIKLLRGVSLIAEGHFSMSLELKRIGVLKECSISKSELAAYSLFSSRE